MRTPLALLVMLVLAAPAIAGGGCDLDPCPPGDFIEPEACGDDLNGGCASTPPVIFEAPCGTTTCGTAWAAGGTRDTDWYEIPDFDGGSLLTATLVSEFDGVVFLVDGMEVCAPVVIAEGGSARCVSTGPAEAMIAPGDSIVIFVATSDFAGTPCGTTNDYRLVVSCGAATPCPEDVDGDGAVGVSDLVAVILAWGAADPAADVDDDGTVGVEDLVLVVTAWGNCRS